MVTLGRVAVLMFLLAGLHAYVLFYCWQKVVSVRRLYEETSEEEVDMVVVTDRESRYSSVTFFFSPSRQQEDFEMRIRQRQKVAMRYIRLDVGVFALYSLFVLISRLLASEEGQEGSMNEFLHGLMEVRGESMTPAELK